MLQSIRAKLLFALLGIPLGCLFLMIVLEVSRNAGTPHVWQMFVR